MDVLYLVREGLYELQISGALGLTVTEVRDELGSIRTKMGARSNTEAAVKAIREHFLDV